MKPLFILLFAMVMPFGGAGDKFLASNTSYQKESYFKQTVYDENDWKTFYKLKEANAAVTPPNYDMHLMNAAVFFSTNRLREKYHLPPLQFMPGLRDAAVVHSQEMTDKRFMDHFNGRTPQLRSPDQRMKLFGVTNAELGENLDMTEYYTPGETNYLQLADTIVNELYNSPPHRKAMLSTSFKYLGCGSVFDSKLSNRVYPVKTTQDFAGK